MVYKVTNSVFLLAIVAMPINHSHLLTLALQAMCFLLMHTTGLHDRDRQHYTYRSVSVQKRLQML